MTGAWEPSVIEGPPAFYDFLDLDLWDDVLGTSHPILDLAVLFGGSVDFNISAVLEENGIGHQDVARE